MNDVAFCWICLHHKLESEYDNSLSESVVCMRSRPELAIRLSLNRVKSRKKKMWPCPAGLSKVVKTGVRCNLKPVAFLAKSRKPHEQISACVYCLSCSDGFQIKGGDWPVRIISQRLQRLYRIVWNKREAPLNEQP